jgi:tRNA uridine 5-carboxymethylaminomethyl modification enzyme
VQLEFVRSIRGFERAHITRPGYAIEYDYFDPRDLRASLETRSVEGLFFAGQINGTTGYEEAGAQGLLAGINAAQQVRGREPWLPGRGESYLGVLVDDLVTRGTREPYRMFTSRAEHRLLLREDNADLRLTPRGRELGLVDDARWEFLNRKRDGTEQELARLARTRVQPGAHADWEQRVLGTPLARDASLLELLRRPEVAYQDLAEFEHDDTAGAMAQLHAWDDRLPAQVGLQVEVRAKYAGYIERQELEIERQRDHETTRLPADIDYARVAGLSNEVRQKLTDARPDTVGQAARVPGVTPAAVSLLLIHLRKKSRAA